MKFLLTFCLIVSLAAVALSTSASWGRRVRGDYLLYHEKVYRDQRYGNNWIVYVNFPKYGQVNNRNISAIYVYDRFTNSSGAFPSLRAGGPGYKFANLNIASQYSKGINSDIEIYGR